MSLISSMLSTDRRVSPISLTASLNLDLVAEGLHAKNSEYALKCDFLFVISFLLCFVHILT
jgi:hypothetical protein